MISIIIPTLNEERSLPSLLDAVCRQVAEYEVIVVDAAWLATQGHVVNRKRVQRLMRLLGLTAIYQRPKTTRWHRGIPPAAAHPGDRTGISAASTRPHDGGSRPNQSPPQYAFAYPRRRRLGEVCRDSYKPARGTERLAC